jgi:hypothetical protein
MHPHICEVFVSWMAVANTASAEFLSFVLVWPWRPSWGVKVRDSLQRSSSSLQSGSLPTPSSHFPPSHLSSYLLFRFSFGDSQPRGHSLS